MRILISTDGSGYGLEAAKKCGEFVSLGADSVVRIISIVEPVPPIAAEPFAGPYNYYAEAEAGLAKAAEAAVAAAKEKVREKFADVEIQTEVIKGNPKSVIVDDAKQFGADLIVVGSHGYGFLERIFLGSVSNSVVHHAHCSVLVVRTADDDEDF